jgi:penicillin-binding protein 1A
MVMQKPPKKIKCRRILEVLFLLLAAFVLLQGAFVLLVRAGTFGKLPGYQELKEIQNPMATEVYSADGCSWGPTTLKNRQSWNPQKFRKASKNALIATEDVRFYSHRGIDTRSLFRVLFKSLLLRREGSGGGSTLTQQLAKNLYPRESFGILTMPVSKVKEMITAVRMEKVYSKQEILEMYLGTVSFGENTFGIKAASRRYFNKDPQDLTLGGVRCTGGHAEGDPHLQSCKSSGKGIGTTQCGAEADEQKWISEGFPCRFPCRFCPSK